MTLDILAALMGVILGGLGYVSGALTQVSRVVGVVLAFAAAPVVARIYKDLLIGPGELAAPMIEWGMLVLAAVSIYGLVAVVSRLLLKLMEETSEELTRTDRLLGGVLGLAKAGLIVYLAASSLLMIEANLKRADPGDALHLRDSRLLALVRDYQIALPWVLPELTRLLELLQQAAEGGDLRALRDDPAASRLLTRTSVRSLLDDPEVVEAAREENLSAFLSNEQVREVLSDAEVRRDLRQASIE